MPELASVVFLEWVDTQHVCVHMAVVVLIPRNRNWGVLRLLASLGVRASLWKDTTLLCLPTTLLYLGLAPPCLC